MFMLHIKFSTKKKFKRKTKTHKEKKQKLEMCHHQIKSQRQQEIY